MAKNGLTRGLNRNEAIVDQSSNKKPTSEQGDFPPIKSDDNIHNHHAVRSSISKGKPSVRKYGDEHVFLHVKRARVKREFPGPEPGNPELRRRQRGGHEPADGERCHQRRDLGDDQRLFPVREELVEEGEEDAGEESEDPHSEGPYWQGRVVGVGYG
nr:Os02g0696200 [Ipomoea batatas]